MLYFKCGVRAWLSVFSLPHGAMGWFAVLVFDVAFPTHLLYRL